MHHVAVVSAIQANTSGISVGIQDFFDWTSVFIVYHENLSVCLELTSKPKELWLRRIRSIGTDGMEFDHLFELFWLNFSDSVDIPYILSTNSKELCVSHPTCLFEHAGLDCIEFGKSTENLSRLLNALFSFSYVDLWCILMKHFSISVSWLLRKSTTSKSKSVEWKI